MISSVFLAIISSLFFSVPHQQDNGGLLLQVNGIKENRGQIMLAVSKSKNQFLKDETFYRAIIPVREAGSMDIELELSEGTYAISIFHDVNADSVLNKNFMGIPKEPYGFSNNAKGTFGPPSYEDASFILKNTGGKTFIDLD
jgi:uncharacterized protein (DUF2141 family)